MRYRVNCHFGRGADLLCAQFKDLPDASLFIEQKLKADARLKVEVTYRIYDFDELLKEYLPLKDGAVTEEQSSSSQGKGSASTFKPTPFNMAPRPGSLPHKWVVDSDEGDDKKDK